MSNDPQRQKSLGDTTQSLARMQVFDTSTLPRIEVLGNVINFADAVAPAERLIDLYRQLPTDVLEQLPTPVLDQLRAQADSDFNILSSILQFEPGNPKGDRDNRVAQLRGAYDPAFNRLHPYISYAVRKSTDFGRLEREARTVVQQATDRATELTSQLDKYKTDAESVLASVRRAAEEQGVTQQASYFKSEADKHDKTSRAWLTWTVLMTIVVTAYTIATLFLHKVGALAPSNTYETTQLAISKVLIFVALSFLLLFCSRTYVAHRHNAIVNRHRQNALLTYEALAKAAGAEANRDVVLSKAADCIFAPQPSGFSKHDSLEGGALSLVNIAPGGVRPTIQT